MKFIYRPFHFLTLIALLLIAAAHTSRLNELPMNDDEIWHIWQSFGTPAQILAWTPYDWTPLYGWVLGGWRLLVGIHPLMLHTLSMLLSMLGAAFAFAAGRRLGGRWAGLFSMLIYGGLAYSIFLSGYVRPYALAHPLVPLGFLLMLHFFDAPSQRYRLGAGILLTLTLTASFYTTLIAPIWIVFFGMYTLIVYPFRRVLARWIPVALAFIVSSIPILMARGALSLGRGDLSIESPPFLEGMSAIGADYGGDVVWVWIGLLVIGSIAWGVSGAFRHRRHARALFGLLVWGLGGLIVLYVLHPVLGFFRPSYAFWTLTAFALMGGVLLTRLSPIGRTPVTLIMMLLLFVPVPARVAENYASPGVTNFTWLRNHVRAGDGVALDPGFDCLAPYELDYLSRAFFPEGLAVTRTIPDARRIWYARNVNTEDQTFAAAVAANRRPSLFIGPPTCLFQLHEAPPDMAGILFANGMRFHGGERVEAMPDQSVATLHPPVAREGETITVRLWWSADSAPPTDYSVGVYVQDAAGGVLAQSDSAPQTEPPETSRWQTGVFYTEERTITLPYPLITSDYRVSLGVYHWQDQIRISAQGIDSDNLLTLFTLSVKSW